MMSLVLKIVIMLLARLRWDSVVSCSAWMVEPSLLMKMMGLSPAGIVADSSSSTMLQLGDGWLVRDELLCAGEATALGEDETASVCAALSFYFLVPATCLSSTHTYLQVDLLVLDSRRGGELTRVWRASPRGGRFRA